jgi:hypothetical protein
MRAYGIFNTSASVVHITIFIVVIYFNSIESRGKLRKNAVNFFRIKKHGVNSLKFTTFFIKCTKEIENTATLFYGKS